MTYNPSEDRNYWRCCDDRRLIAAARDSGHELAIALGERLDDLTDLEDELKQMRIERDELVRRVDDLKGELNALLADDTAAEAEAGV